LVLIQSGNRTGTGFFVSADGVVITAFHVLGDRLIESLPNNQFKITLMSPSTVSIKTDIDSFSIPLSASLNSNADEWGGRCRLRDECLNANWFTSLHDARRKIEEWRQD
jgi:hypothetical protein